MTAQGREHLFYKEQRFIIADVTGDGLFDPKNVGLKVTSPHTACWKGYHCEYAVVDDTLLLTELNVGLRPKDKAMAQRGEGPLVFEKTPKMTFFGEFAYIDLKEPVQFTGLITIALDVIELFSDCGTCPAYAFRDVHQLVFDKGKLLSDTDISVAMAQHREDLAKRQLEGKAKTNGIIDWIRRAFARDKSRSGKTD